MRNARYCLAILAAGACRLSLAVALSAQEPHPSMVLVPELRIDSSIASPTSVNWVARAANGDIAVWHATGQLMQFFNADGKLVGTRGGPQNPTNGLTSVDRFYWVHDSLYVREADSQRIVPAALNSKGRTIPMIAWNGGKPPSVREVEMFNTVTPQAFYDDGSMLVFVGRTGPGSAVVPDIWATAPDSIIGAWVAVSSAGRFQRVVAWVPVNPCVASAQGPRGVATVSAPFCAPPIVKASSEQPLVVIERTFAAGPNAGKYEVTMIGGHGDTVFSRKYPFAMAPVGTHAADSANAVNTSSAAGTGAGLASFAPSRASANTIKPPLAGFAIGHDSSVWLATTTTTATGTMWTVLNSRGDVIGTVIVPKGLGIHSFDATTVWATEIRGKRAMTEIYTSRSGRTGDLPITGDLIRLRLTPVPVQ